jgi:hypothetical protein
MLRDKYIRYLEAIVADRPPKFLGTKVASLSSPDGIPR